MPNVFLLMILSNLVKNSLINEKKIESWVNDWLGFSLAKSLIVNGYEVYGSSTSIEKKRV